jgi:hypothetical protein
VQIRTIAERVLARRFGEEGEGRGFMTTAESERGDATLLSWDGAALACFEKRAKSTLELRGLLIETSDFPDIGSGERQHKLHITNVSSKRKVL